jgi:hypothetical protein
MGFEPMTPVLPRLCATTAPHGPAKLPVRHRIYLKASAFGQRDDAHPFLTCHRTGLPGIASRQRRRCQSFRQASPLRNHESRTAWWAVEDSNLRRQSQLIYSQSRLTASVTALVYVPPEPTDGVEPTTYGLQNRCSAIELRRPTLCLAHCFGKPAFQRDTLLARVIAHVLYTAKQRAVKASMRRFTGSSSSVLRRGAGRG